MTKEETEKRAYEMRTIFKSIFHNILLHSGDGIKGAERGVLFALSHLKKKGPVTPSQIAREMKLTYPAVSHQIHSLEKKKLIVQQYSNSDRRVNYLTLSPEGEEVLRQIKKCETERLYRLIEFLGEEDSVKFRELILKIADFFEQEEQIQQEQTTDHEEKSL